MDAYRTLDDLEVAGKRVLLRLDLNVPMQDGRVSDATRIERALPTLTELLQKGARVVVLSHFGRPKGERKPELSLAPVAEAMGEGVGFADDCIGERAQAAVAALAPGQAVLLENLRFHAGEEANDPAFAGALAALGEVYANDAFSAAHRAHASVEGLARRLPAAAGRLMQAELEHLEQALEACRDRDIDAAEMDEVFLDDDDPDFGMPPLEDDPSGVPEISPNADALPGDAENREASPTETSE